MSTELPINPKNMAKAYDPTLFEEAIYNWWERQGYFKPEQAGPEAKPFVIAMPPPNVTGALHIGHAMTASIEDLLIRYQRMQGRAALWIPGTDHAGIATQLQVERALRAEGTSRQELGRDKFLERTWAWKEEYGGIITQQHRRLGVSCDWERERFTLDEGLSRAVREGFVRLYEKGLIYRGEYLINWSPGLQTAVSDLEVEYFEEEGQLYYFKYMLADADDYIPVATTRPETILGDTALAVHPEDDRYKHLVGQQCVVPVFGRQIPIIADDYVDREFGTGALKITPGHDAHDFAFGQKHGLPAINLLNRDATMNDQAGPYQGLDRFECRQKLWADMQTAGLVIEVKPHRMQVPRSQRGGEIVEPMLSTQWFVRTQPLAEKALAAVANGEITLIPERFTKIYNNWLENIRDWCISRQLWWGHRIPVWYCDSCGQMTVAREDPIACAHCASCTIAQDPDVLDTWFSSGLWPFSTLGWPDDTPDLRRYYPNDVMETGYDILFFWVARMIMSGLEYTDTIPFHTVYLHGLIRDEHGRKMSKSFGNVINPLEMIEQYSADALRFSLLTGSTPGNDMNLSIERIAANRNFCNKIWNATRFVVNNLGTAFESGMGTWNMSGLIMPDRWILSRLNRLVTEVTRLMDDYNFGEAGRQLYDFFWSEYADWYIEVSKIRLYGTDPRAQTTARRVLVHVLDRTLRMLHPFIPFVTEAAWQHLPHEEESLMITKWPRSLDTKPHAEAEAAMSTLIDIIRAIRAIRSEYDVAPAKKITAYIAAGEQTEMIEKYREIVTTLARLAENEFHLAPTLAHKPEPAAGRVISGGIEIYLPLADLIDLETERERWRKEAAQLGQRIAASQQKLDTPNFAQKAPPAVVEKERERLADLKLQAIKVRDRLQELG
jgi:valyl-tRNA synthetase